MAVDQYGTPIDSSDPSGASGTWGHPGPGQQGYVPGQNWIGQNQYWWTGPGNQEYLSTVGMDPSKDTPYGGKYGTPTTAADPWGNVGMLSSQANEWGLKNNPGDMFSRMGPAILGLPFAAYGAGQMAFGDGLSGILGGATPGVDPATGAGGFGEGAPGVMTPADGAVTSVPGMDNISIPTGNIPGATENAGTDPYTKSGTGTMYDTANIQGGTDLTGAGTTTFPSTSGISGGDIWNFLKQNKNLILPGAAMAASAFKKPDLSTGGLESVAGDIKGYMNMLTGGQLPPGAEASVSNALNAAKQSIRSKYASMGMSGSTMEAQDLSQAESRAAEMRFTVAQQIAQTGLSAAGLDAGIYGAIMQATLSQDQQLQNALANFAMAAALGSAR